MLTEGNRNSNLGGEWSIEWTGGALKTNGFEGSKFLKFAHDSHVSERKRFGGAGWVWGAWASRVGWCGAVLRVWARLADIDFGAQINTGFSFKWSG